MKKLLFGAIALGMMSACTNDNMSNQNETSANPAASSPTTALQRSCLSEEIRQEALQKSPELRQRYAELEANTERFAKNAELGKVLTDGSVEIPVVVNILYSNAAENLSDARIAEQIDVLNADYSGTNTDVTNIPANGGIDATSPSNYLNIWIVGKVVSSDGRTILGYATFPESAGLWNDGVVIPAPYFGKTGAAANFNLGRTATHEVGHYLNLRHIWGDAKCGDDLVADTPTQTSENYDTPTYPLYNRCSGKNRSVMFMNYMDYVDDKVMHMFTANQKQRMQAVVSASGPRSGLRLY